MFRAGMSTACFYPETTERSLELAIGAGAGSVEIFVNADSEFSLESFRDYRARAQAGAVEIVSIHPYTSGFETMIFFSDYSRRFEDGLRLYRRFFELAAFAGAKFLVLHGAASHAKLEDQLIFERFAQLARVGRECGVTLLQENVSRCKSRSPEFIRAMRAQLGDEAAFVLDTKQAVRAGFSVEEMLAAMGPALRHIHISDQDGERDCLPPGIGRADLAGLFSRLCEIRYGGDVVLELYRDSYSDLRQLYESFVYLKRLLSNSCM